MECRLPKETSSLLFVDTARLGFYVRHLDYEHPRSPFPQWEPAEGYGSGGSPGDYDPGVIGDLDKVITSLESSGYASRGPLTASDGWFVDGVLTVKGAYRLENATARRVRIPAENGGELRLWVSISQERKLYLWESRAEMSEPPLYSRSSDDTAAYAFTQYSYRPLQEAAFDYLDLVRDAEGFRRDPIGALWRLGARAGSEQDVTLFYGMTHVVYPVEDEEGLVATFGFPIAVWERPPAPMAEAVEGVERVLIFLSVDDEPTQSLVKQIRASRLLHAYTFSFEYAIDRYGASGDTDANQLGLRMRQAIDRSDAEAMIVHLSSVYAANESAYRDALADIRKRYPDLLVISDAAVHLKSTEVWGIEFDLIDELCEIVQHIFF